MVRESGAGRKDVELVSPLPLERCQELLAAGISSPLAILGRQPVTGKLSGTKLRARKRVRFHDFHIWVRAEMVERAEHTHIRCRFSRDWPTGARIAVPYGVAMLLAIPTLAN